MAYYAALASLVQLLDDIILHHRYPTFLLASHPLVKSLHHKFTSLEESLQHYSSNGDELNNRLEGRIRDVAYRAQDIIELEISNQSCLQESTSINRTCLRESNRINRTSSEERIDTMKKCSPMSCFGCFRGKKFDKEYSIVEKLQMVEQETSSVVEKTQMVEQETSSVVEEIHMLKQETSSEPSSVLEEIEMVEQETSFVVKEIQMVKQETNSIVEDLRMVEEEANSILEEMMAIKEGQTSEDLKLIWDSSDTLELEQAPSTEHIMVGLDEDLIIIKDQLCNQSSQLKVIPIVGMGGIGKTTLARNAFDDALVAYHFDLRAWVTVSQDYHENAVLESIVKSLGLVIEELDGGDESDLKECIYKCLKGRRYLIVVYDIWSTEVWDDVRRISPNDRNGSRIVLTTRLLDLARYANPGFVHEMRFLNEDESWNLLQKKVFEQECCPPELENIGIFIASKCCGLPLAVIVIAGILTHSKTLHHWENIAGKVSTMLGISDEQINRILSLSYNHLSHQLKACFLYLGSFPEDYEIDIANLVRLWIADGFLKSNDNSKLVEKVGEEFLEDLVKRNLVLITKKRSNGQFKNCILHDLVRGFCRQRAFYECFFHVKDMETGHLYPVGIEEIRRINYYRDPNKRYHGCILRNIGKLTRSVNCHDEWLDANLFALHDVKLLRIFNSSQYYYKRIPDVFLGLFQLKYFGFSTYVFPSILELQNLQTLIIYSRPREAIILPRQIWQMTHLRHLIIPKMILPSVPMVCDHTPIHKLESLQTLMTVEECEFPNELIQMIMSLRKLKVRCFRTENCLKNLVHLPHLEELKITFHRITSEIYFPLTLKKLSLSYCAIPKKVMTKVGSLPNLQVLKLGWFSFVGEEWEPIEGEFPRLKFLQLYKLRIKYWRAECTHFPCLEYLKILYCEELEMIPLEIGDIPTLKVIEVLGSDAAANYAIQIQEDQRDQGNDALQVFINMESRQGDEGSVKRRYMELSHP